MIPPRLPGQPPNRTPWRHLALMILTFPLALWLMVWVLWLLTRVYLWLADSSLVPRF